MHQSYFDHPSVRVSFKCASFMTSFYSLSLAHLLSSNWSGLYAAQLPNRLVAATFYLFFAWTGEFAWHHFIHPLNNGIIFSTIVLLKPCSGGSFRALVLLC